MKRFSYLALLIVLALFGCGKDSGTSGGGNLPSITGVSPSNLNPGTENIEGRILGTNLSGVTSVQMGPGVIVHQFSGLSAGEIYIYISVLRDAPPGPHTVSVATAAGAAQSSGAFTVGDNALPVAKFTVTPPLGYKSTSFKFDASGSNDPGGSITHYQWRLGDGAVKNGKVINHQFQRAGTFQVKLTVTDNRGATHEATRELDVEPSRAPVAEFSVSPDSGTIGTTFRFDASRSRDPDGKISSYVWNFGDGGSSRGMVVEHKYTTSSTFSVSLSVRDNTGVSSNSLRSLPVRENPEPPPPGPGPEPPPGGGTCNANDFRANPFDVVDVSGNTITGNVTFRNCPGLCGEVRRAANGIREFVGDVVRLSGSQITFDPGNLPPSTRPDVGERLYLIWRPCGS